MIHFEVPFWDSYSFGGEGAGYFFLKRISEFAGAAAKDLV